MTLFADFADVIEMAATDVQVERKRPGTYVGGVYRKSTTSDVFTIRGSFQPASEEEIQRLSELQRTDESFAFFTTAELQIGEAGNVEEPDLLTHGGKVFEVSAGGDWSHLGNYRKYLVTGVAQ